MTEKAKLYKSVDILRESLGLNDNEPADTKAMILSTGHIDLTYHNFSTPGLCGIAMVGDKIDTVVLNTQRSFKEQCFDAGHELIHLYKHRNTLDHFNCFSHNHPKQNSFIEWQANEGSAELILPYRLFVPLIANALPSLNSLSDIHDFKSQLSDIFYATSATINNRLEGLKYEIYQYAHGTSLEDLEFLSRRDQVKRNICVDSVNDMETFYLYKYFESLKVKTV